MRAEASTTTITLSTPRDLVQLSLLQPNSTKFESERVNQDDRKAKAMTTG